MSISGLSQARLGRMYDVMTGYVERGEVPGLVTLVSRRGEIHGQTGVRGELSHAAEHHLPHLLHDHDPGGGR